MRRPLARAVVGGLALSTAATLLVVPAFVAGEAFGAPRRRVFDLDAPKTGQKENLMATKTFLIIPALAAALALPAGADADERKLSRAQVPPPVLAAFEKAYPNAKAVAFAEEKEDGKACYEIESQDGATLRDVLFSADGTLLEVGEGIPVADLPVAVREAVKKSAPGATIKGAEKVTRNRTVRFEVKLSGGATKELLFDADGRPVEE